MKLKVRKITEQANTFCGPAALSIVTGRSVEACEQALRAQPYRQRNAAPIKGIYNWELLKALETLNMRVASFASGQLGKKWTFAKWLAETRVEREAKDVLILNIGHHYIVLKGRKVFDNAHPNGVFIRKYPHRRYRVHAVWLVWCKEAKKFLPTLSSPATLPPTSQPETSRCD